MVSLPRDLRAAIRALTRKPGVTALAIASLALAIGFSTAAFSVLDAYALRDLPVNAPGQLARIMARTREQRLDDMTWIEYQALASRAHSFSGVLTENRQGPRVRLPDRDDFPITAGGSDNYFDLLGVKALMGDVFHTGKGEDGTVVVAYKYWKDMLAGDPSIVGRTLPVGRGMLRVIGVLPPGFTGTNRGLLVSLFVPSQTLFGALRQADPNDVADRNYELIGRLRPGATLAQAQVEADSILRQVDRDGRAPGPDRTSSVVAFAEGDLWAKLQENAVLLGVVVLLLLIAAANLANLRLVENQARRLETGIRLALGAGRSDLARQHFTETLLLAGSATLFGLLLAKVLIAAAPSLLYAGISYIDYNIRFDARTFLFSSAALAVVALAGALIPFSDAWKQRLLPALQTARTTGSSRWLGVLVIAQMALVTGVTCSAGLLWRSLENISAIRPAMDPDRRLLLVEGAFSGVGASVVERTAALAQGVAALPGIQNVAWARRAMLSGSGGGAKVGIEMPGQPRFEFPYNQVSPSYFAATGARILSGRGFRESDSAKAALVVMVSSTFVRRFFAGRDPLGAWIKVEGKDRQIVGVVEDGPQNHLREIIEPYFYFPFAQLPTRYFTMMVETRGDPGLLAAQVRQHLRKADPAFVVSEMLTMRQHMRNSRSDEEIAAQVTGGLAAIGLLLAAAGLFGVTLFAVARRTPEFGIRVAMGATPLRLAGMVLRDAALRVAIAIPLGWALAYAGRRAIGKLLFGVAADDPWTFVLTSLVVALVACAAALHPAARAARIDPMTALRHE